MTRPLTLCYPRKGGRITRPGRVTGGARRCQLEGCLGRRIGVRWPDGRITWPCTRGMMVRRDGQYEIL